MMITPPWIIAPTFLLLLLMLPQECLSKLVHPRNKSRMKASDEAVLSHQASSYGPALGQASASPGFISASGPRLALNPVQSDFLEMNIKSGGQGSYNIHELPCENGQPVLVEVSISLRNILEIDEHRQLVTLETTLRLYWTDLRLKVDHLLAKKPYDYILLNPESANFIWFPDIYIDFAKNIRLPTVVVKPASLRIYRNSTARYATQINYDVACPMNFHKYPYDTQTCKVKFESYGHTVERMRVVWKKGFDQSKVTDNNYISLAQFEYAVFFEENYEEEIASGVYPGVIMTLLFRRKISYHLLQTYLPSGLFVIVAWFSLFLPPESIPGRITMAMTTLLTLAAMFGAVRQNTPKVSYVSALDVWMCTCILFVFFALVEYVVILCLISQKEAKEQEYEEESSFVSSRAMAMNSRPNLCRRHLHLAASRRTISRSSMGNDIVAIGRRGCEVAQDEQVTKYDHLTGGGCCGTEALIGGLGSERNFQSAGYLATPTRCPSAQLPEQSQTTKVSSPFFSCCRRSKAKRVKGHCHGDIRLAGSPGVNFQRGKGRPFHQVEKICSSVMALLFILFNAIYWTWLMSDQDFDYAKFEASRQI